MRRDRFLIACMLAIIVLLLVLTVAVASDMPKQADYSGSASLVLEIIDKHNLSDPDYPIPVYGVLVLYSNDSTIVKGSMYQLQICEHMTGYFGTVAGTTPESFRKGSVIGIDFYEKAYGGDMAYPNVLFNFDNRTIAVSVEADPKNSLAWDNAWKQKMKILN